ncbi:ankyrin repeat-containing protein BDA1-like [Argentina anserina]|uniref:ankyrin repeat-containing protein BDA1-like n=1 Tax=Argentina anserina TaxID=57926 RepID=UPI00217637DF|nr:ankyrin repeat-containing protein BDA1-like [Potentilla anserina]
MDMKQLLKASQTGDVPLLRQLLTDNQQLLEYAPLASAENPLSLATAAGHVDFVEEILKSKRSLAKELNKDGFSPMHVASANGYLEIVRALLRAEPECLQVKGKDEWTPLHCAARRGRADIIQEIVSACPESVEHVTILRESALHLAVKNSQFEAIRVLLELVREMEKPHVLNMKDNLGNSVLHLATWKKQHQVVEWLVGIGTAPAGVLEVDSVNQRGLTALDLLLAFQSEAGDREIEQILRGAGADLRAREGVRSHSDNHTQMSSQTHQEELDDMEYFKFQKGIDSVDNARTALLVVAVLVATASYEIALNPPGGLWSDTNLNPNGTEPPHLAATANIASFFPIYSIFGAILNCIGFSVSLHMIYVLTTNFPLRLELIVCGLAMYVTYINGLITISPGETAGWYSLFALTPALPPVVLFAARRVRTLLNKLKALLRNRMPT